MNKELVKKLITELGGTFSRELGIDLSSGEAGEIFRWFLAAKLFGARISTAIAMKTYREFERCGVTTPQTILDRGWDGLVSILDAGGYVRYDFSTASRLLAIMATLMRSYGGDLNDLHRQATDTADLEKKLKELGPGIGDVTVNIFLRELRTVWPKARPELAPPALLAAGRLGLVGARKNPLAALEKIWLEHALENRDFCDLEAALVRLGKNYCRKGRHENCPLRDDCGMRESADFS